MNDRKRELFGAIDNAKRFGTLGTPGAAHLDRTCVATSTSISSKAPSRCLPLPVTPLGPGLKVALLLRRRSSLPESLVAENKMG
jgi:hypothetical protein